MCYDARSATRALDIAERVMSESALPFKDSVANRMDVIAPLVRGRKTLDLGVVDSRTQKDDTAARLTVKGATSLHAAIREINPEVLGVDVDREGIDILSGQDFNVRVADVLTMQLGEEFETIIAGDIIEHLDNAGLFLRNVAEHITGDGVLLISKRWSGKIGHLDKWLICA